MHNSTADVLGFLLLLAKLLELPLALRTFSDTDNNIIIRRQGRKHRQLDCNINYVVFAFKCAKFGVMQVIQNLDPYFLFSTIPTFNLEKAQGYFLEPIQSLQQYFFSNRCHSYLPFLRFVSFDNLWAGLLMCMHWSLPEQ